MSPTSPLLLGFKVVLTKHAKLYQKFMYHKTPKPNKFTNLIILKVGFTK